MLTSNLPLGRRLAAAALSAMASAALIQSALADDKTTGPIPATISDQPAKGFKMPAWVSTEATALVKAQKPTFDAWYGGLQKKLAAEGTTSQLDIKRVALEVLKSAQGQVGTQISELQVKARQAVASKLADAKQSALQKGKETLVGLSEPDQLTLKNLTEKKSQLEQMTSELTKKASDAATGLLQNLK
jgi:hypothetical protein